MTKLGSTLIGFLLFHWSDAIKLIFYKQQADKKSSTTSTKTGRLPSAIRNSGVAWFSFLLRGVCLSAAEFTLCISPRLVKLIVALCGAGSCGALSHAYQRLVMPGPSSYTAIRQAGPLWVHLEKLLCKLPLHSFIICLSLCQLLKVLGSTNISQSKQPRNNKWEKGQIILLLLQTEKFCDLPYWAGKSILWFWAGKDQLLLQTALCFHSPRAG